MGGRGVSLSLSVSVSLFLSLSLSDSDSDTLSLFSSSLSLSRASNGCLGVCDYVCVCLRESVCVNLFLSQEVYIDKSELTR